MKINRKFYGSVFLLILATALMGLVLIPVAIALMPVLMVRPGLGVPVIDKLMGEVTARGTRMIVKSMGMAGAK